MKHPVLRNVSEESWTNTEQASNETCLLRKSIAQPCTALSSDYAARQSIGRNKAANKQVIKHVFFVRASHRRARHWLAGMLREKASVAWSRQSCTRCVCCMCHPWRGTTAWPLNSYRSTPVQIYFTSMASDMSSLSTLFLDILWPALH